MNFVIDYLTFSIRATSHSQTLIHIEDIAKTLNIDKYLPDFFVKDHGKARFYEHCYSYNGIAFYTTDYERGVSLSEHSIKKFYTQGLSCEIKGEGCAFLEHRPVASSAGCNGTSSVWYNLFSYLIMLSKVYHYKINISRIDFAYDEITYIDSSELPKLSLDDIASATLSNDDHRGDIIAVTSSRSRKEITENVKIKRFNSDIKKFVNTPAIGRTIYFGNRNSDFYCRFYDKLVEQHIKCKNDPFYLRDTLGQIKTWTRFESVFKGKHAVSLMWAFCESSDFSAFLAKVVNNFIRFVVNDDSNVSRCKVCLWWEEFMLTAESASLSTHKLVKNEFMRAVQWISRSVATSLKAVADNRGMDFIVELINSCSAPYKPKHRRIAECADYSEPCYLSYEELEALKPIDL